MYMKIHSEETSYNNVYDMFVVYSGKQIMNKANQSKRISLPHKPLKLSHAIINVPLQIIEIGYKYHHSALKVL